MTIKTLVYKGKVYPSFQADGFAAQYAFPFAKLICTGTGVDVGCCKEEWKLPGAIAIDPQLNEYHATKFPYALAGELDYIFSSHCLEHVPDWVGALDYWNSQLKPRGKIFLYLPHPGQEYWKPWNNRKHIHYLHPDMIKDYLSNSGKWNRDKVFVKGPDLNDSYYAVAEKWDPSELTYKK